MQLIPKHLSVVADMRQTFNNVFDFHIDETIVLGHHLGVSIQFLAHEFMHLH